MHSVDVLRQSAISNPQSLSSKMNASLSCESAFGWSSVLEWAFAEQKSNVWHVWWHFHTNLDPQQITIQNTNTHTQTHRGTMVVTWPNTLLIRRVWRVAKRISMAILLKGECWATLISKLRAASFS